MNARRATIPVVFVLMVLGALCINFRTLVHQKKKSVPGDSFWTVSYQVRFKADKAGAKVHVAYPEDTPTARLLSHRAPDLGRFQNTKTHGREVLITANKAGQAQADMQFDIHLRPHGAFRPGSAAGKLTAEQRARWLQSERGIQLDDPQVIEVLDRLRRDPSSQMELLDRLVAHCQTGIGFGDKDAPNDAAGALKQNAATPLGRARAMVALCRAAKLPARLVTGFQIREATDVHPHVWVEVYTGDQWEPFDPDSGFSHELPHTFLAVRHDGASIAYGANVKQLQSSFTMRKIPPPPEFRPEAPRLSDILDLTRLPVEIRRAFAVILLMPIGALVTAIFRTIIGIRTFGTFTPSLIALSFIYNDAVTGIAVFLLVMLLGLTSRGFLEHLKLLLVPRLSIILTLVVLCIVFAVSTLDYFGVTRSTDAVLLPLVILTMTVERFYLTTEEDSAAFATQLLSGSLLVSACCYLILRWEAIGNLFLRYPEAHFITIGVLILLGRYSGYRLTELWRFRDVGGK